MLALVRIQRGQIHLLFFVLILKAVCDKSHGIVPAAPNPFSCRLLGLTTLGSHGGSISSLDSDLNESFTHNF